MLFSRPLLLFFIMISLGLQAQNLGVKIADGTLPITTLDVNGAVSFREGTALTLTNGVNSNIALTDYSFFRITGPTAAFSITGFAGGNDGRMLTIMNNTSQIMTLTHQATSTSANQINTGGLNTTIGASGIVTLYYNTNLSKWVVTATTGATPTFTTITIGTYSDSLIVINNGIPGRVPPREYIETYAWGIDGNTGTTGGTHYVGTTDDQPLVFKTNATEAMRILPTSYVGINTSTPLYKLDIDAQTGSAGNPLRLLGLSAGATSDSIVTSSSGILRRMATNSLAWTLTGNSGTVDGTNYIGTSDNIPLSIRVNNQKAGRIDHLQSNAFWGYQAGNAITSGSYNTAMGQSALAALTQGVANLGVGTSALAALTLGSDNTAVGSSTLATMTTGHSNIAIGNQSGLSNTTGVRNVSIGYQSARNGTHSNSIMIGYQAGMQNAASNNVFIGSLSGPLTSTGSDNIGMGYYTLFNNTTGKNNIGIGSFALSTSFVAWGNTAIGHMSSASIQSGQANTALGDSSLLNNVLGNNNTAFGYRAGDQITGSNNIAIGYNAQVPVPTSSNQLALGSWLYGTGGFLGINTTTPQYKLDIDANTSGTGNPLRLQGLQAGATSDSIISSNGGILRRLSIAQVVGSGAWSTTGNASTVDGTNFIGTTDNIPFNVRVFNQKAGRIDHINGNTFWGYLSGNVNTGTYNTFIGNQAGTANTTGINNVALGYQSLGTNTTGQNNTAVGSEALVFASIGNSNTATGRYAMRKTTTGSNNAAYGTYSLQENTTGINNTAIGYQALVSTTTANNNTGVGAQAILTNTTGAENVGMGFQSLYQNTSGSYNTSLGNYSMFKNTSGNNNVVVGPFALGENLTSWGNTAIGYKAAFYNSVNGIVAVGDSALFANTIGTGNTAVGYQAGATTTANYGTFIGYQAGKANTTGTNNTMMGYQAGLVNTTGLANTFIGYLAGTANIGGNTNVALGTWALTANTSGSSNVALGSGTLGQTTTGNNSIAIGTQAGSGGTTGSNHVYIGYQAGANTTSGDNNTFIGYNSAQSVATSNNNTLLGYGTSLSSGLTNATAIGYTATVTASNSLVLGGTGANVVNVGIGVTAPVNKLDVEGGAVIGSTYAGTNTAPTNGLLVEGNVGIGLTSPSVKLHQDNGNATATYHKFTAGTTTGQTSSDGFDVGVDASGNAVLNQKEALPLIMSANNAEVMRVTSAGNVLIGGNLTPGEVTAVALVNQSASDQKDDVTITTYNTTTTPAFVIFKARGTAAAPTVLTNNELIGGFNANGYIGSAFTGLTAITSVTASDFTTTFGADIAFKTTRSGTSNERMRIMSTGNVGIGTATPTQRLTVFNGTTTGTYTTTGWLHSSDERLKTNIHPLSKALDKVMALNGVYFNWKITPHSNLQIGFIAQQVEKVLPEVVLTDDKGMKSMAYGNLTALHNEAIKEQQNQIEALKKENTLLRVELETMKTALNKQGNLTESLIGRLEKLEASLKANSEKEAQTKPKR